MAVKFSSSVNITLGDFFDHLPQEILNDVILPQLDIPGLLSLRCVSRGFCKLASQDKYWIDIGKKINYILNNNEIKSLQISVFEIVKNYFIRLKKIAISSTKYLRSFVNQNFKNSFSCSINNINILADKILNEKQFLLKCYEKKDFEYFDDPS